MKRMRRRELWKKAVRLGEVVILRKTDAACQLTTTLLEGLSAGSLGRKSGFVRPATPSNFNVAGAPSRRIITPIAFANKNVC